MKDYALVGCGAGMGATARFAFTQLLGAGAWPVVIINVIGCLLMGRLRPGLFWGTGVLGGFTTFSAFEMAREPLPMAVTVVGCLLAWQLGDTFARRAEK